MTRELTTSIADALRGDPRIQATDGIVRVALEGEDVVLKGEVSTIAAKRIAFRRATDLAPGRVIVDRLHVRPATAMTDAEILDHVCRSLLNEPALQEVGVSRADRGRSAILRYPLRRQAGTVEVRCIDGIVTLDGEMASLAHKRLAGVLAWWVPGSRDVINGLGVEPPEEDTDEEVSEAVRVALEKDPFVAHDRVGYHTRGWIVTLTGTVPSEAERDMVEADAWYVFGVDGVDNLIEVKA